MSFDLMISHFVDSNIIIWAGVGSLVMFFLTMLDIAADYFGDRERDWKDTGVNVLTGITKELLARTFVGAAAVVALYVIYLFIPWEIPHVWWTWVLAVLAADLTYYWMHRFEHEVRILWAHHSVHHSSEEFNLSVAYRLSWFEDLIEWVFLIPMILIGFTVPQTIIGLIIVAIYQHWVHTERIGHLGWIDKVFNTPSAHRVHHGSNPVYIDKNYGGILMVWDHLFGTFEPEVETVKYGLINNLDTYNVVTVHAKEYFSIARDVWKTPGLYNKWMLVFGRPGWSPEKRNEKES